MQYDLVDLRLFLHVVAAGSITAGAERTNLSLPSASARIRTLERHARVELLVRGRRGVRPTPAGTALARHAREVLDRAARLDGAIASYARPQGKPLSLLAGSSAMHDLVPRAVTSFLLANPDLDVDVAEHRSVVTARMLLDGEADLGLVIEHTAAEAGLTAEPLCDDSLVVICRAGGALADRRSLTYAEVVEHPMVGLQAGAPLQVALALNVGPSGPVARHRTRAMDLRTVVALAAAGAGLAIVPRRATGGRRGDELDVCELREPWARRRLTLCRGAAVDPSSPGAAAVEELAGHVRTAASLSCRG
ncbi:MAG: LysR family transcriptional regulator [Pseudonocardia sp.]|uniref:LysR family transcriptional regulator n=1 Tax=unclassified Pseudonocardia TaxID=2619320 RepID=UPI00086F62BE|nr:MULTISPECIES: LysR family transcriptional regulator [unclassified Pseudonocardia]MBN9110350.1 LysR family transcriptional regulator [Pseudonocardia sp.]ODU21267.1 MAG: LysR family transcriptional regulator [Pseudonocardia sp. SCN 72-51]ODV06461.1 MAG: LysR family transcriptional regulator [Pseudonocardia sp. SCN 73-27]